MGNVHNLLYTQSSHQDSEASPDIVIGMLKIFSHDAYLLFDPSSTISYMARYFGLGPKNILDLFSISTLVDKSIIARSVYRGYVVLIIYHATVVDLMELDMVDFEVILGMDWI